jgi:hypothetical protein
VTFTQTKEGTPSAIKLVHPGVFLEIEIEAFKSETFNARDFKWYNSQTKERLLYLAGGDTLAYTPSIPNLQWKTPTSDTTIHRGKVTLMFSTPIVEVD